MPHLNRPQNDPGGGGCPSRPRRLWGLGLLQPQWPTPSQLPQLGQQEERGSGLGAGTQTRVPRAGAPLGTSLGPAKHEAFCERRLERDDALSPPQLPLYQGPELPPGHSRCTVQRHTSHKPAPSKEQKGGALTAQMGKLRLGDCPRMSLPTRSSQEPLVLEYNVMR